MQKSQFYWSDSKHSRQRLCVGDGDLHLHTGLDADAGDLLDNLRWTVKVNEALVNPHLESVPGLGTFTTRSLAGSDAQSLIWERERGKTFYFDNFATPSQASVGGKALQVTWLNQIIFFFFLK